MTLQSVTTNQGLFNSADYDLDRVMKIITASILGDGSLIIDPQGKNARYDTAKTIGHDAYFNWLRSVVEQITQTRTYTRPEKVYSINGRFGVSKTYSQLTSRTHPLLTGLHAAYYRNGKKIVPEDLELDLEMVAILLQDDGTRNVSYGFIQICTSGFDLQSVTTLHSLLIEATDLPWSIVKAGALKDGTPAYNIYLGRRYVEELANLLKPYVFSSYYHKLGLEPDGVTPIPLKTRAI
jgi:hypothetical protein